jgi:hypothetical protein
MHQVLKDMVGGDMTFLDAMDRVRRTRIWSHTPLDFIFPPLPPESPIVTNPMSLALATAAMRFDELPLA